MEVEKTATAKRAVRIQIKEVYKKPLKLQQLQAAAATYEGLKDCPLLMRKRASFLRLHEEEYRFIKTLAEGDQY